MIKVIFLIFFFIRTCLFAQTKELFLEELKQNLHSYNALSTVLNKHKTDNNNWVQPTTNFFGCKSFFHLFIFKKPIKDTDKPVYAMPIRVYFKEDKIVYLTAVLKGEWDKKTKKDLPNDTLLRYIDTFFSDSTLSEYNKKNNTHFTWRDLFEDKIDRFYITPGLGGRMNETTWTLKYIPLINRKNHSAIVQECKSFNSVRNVYGALALFFLQRNGEQLTEEETVLLNSISSSPVLINYSYACSADIISAGEALKSEIGEMKK